MINPIIESIKREVPFDFWKNSGINTILDDNKIIDLYNLDEQLINSSFESKSINTSEGYFVLNEGNIYIVTCYHGIKDCYYNNILLENTKYPLNLVFNIPEFDMSVFTVSNLSRDLIKCKIHDITLVKTVLPKVEEKIKLVNNKKIIKTKVKEIIEEDTGSNFFTSITQICVNRTKDITNLFGLSGTPCYNKDDEFIGHVFSYNPDTNNINILPSYCLKYVFEYIIPNKVKQLNRIIFDGKLYKIYNDELNEFNHAYKIEKSNNVEYKIYGQDNSYVFKKNMMIISIDNNKLNNKGKIYFDKLDTFVSPEIYVLLNNNKKFFKLAGYEHLNGNYSYIEINLEPTNILDYMVFSENTHNKIMIYKNLVFAELSRDLMELIKVINKDSKIKDKLENPFNKKYTKQLVLIDIIEKFSDENTKLINIKKNFEMNNLIFVNKVNKKNIGNLEELLEEIKLKSENNFTFEVKKATYKTLLY